MASNESPSFFVISSAEFDGTTPLTAVWTPDPSPRSQPRSYASPSTGPVGRISYKKLGQPGTIGQLVTARTWNAAALITLTVRSENSAENTAGNNDFPAPNNLDAALISRALTTDWCAPFLQGPTDAIALQGGLVSPAPATVELLTVDLQDAAALAYLNAIFTAASLSPTVTVRTEAADRVMTERWNGLRIFRCTQGAAQTMTLIAATSAFVGQEAHFICTGAGGLTVNGGGTNIISAGASAATKAIAQNTCMRLVSDGTTWNATV